MSRVAVVALAVMSSIWLRNGYMCTIRIENHDTAPHAYCGTAFAQKFAQILYDVADIITAPTAWAVMRSDDTDINVSQAELAPGGSDRCPRNVITSGIIYLCEYVVPIWQLNRAWHAADPEVVEALLHPLMYGAFLRVGERDLQMALLEGDQITKQKLAEIFLSRFIRRAKDRLAHNLKKGEVESLLCTVACACDGATQHTREDWKTAACGTSFVNDTQAERWYGEARSGGLITRGNAQGSWIWRHRIVWEYLAQQGTV